MLRAQLQPAMGAGWWRCRIRRRSISTGAVVQLPVLVRPVTTKYGAFSFIPSWRWTPMTKRCLAWREHRFGRGEESTPNHNNIPFAEKESHRWLEAAQLAA